MKRDALYLRHILEAVQKIETYTAGGREAFMDGSHWQDATIRQLEIVGEATKQLSAELRAAYPDGPWRRVAGLRDVLIHDYFGVELTAIWQLTQIEIPRLRNRVEIILRTVE
jgi:uncharacterized protein with HEPN domain